MHNEIKRIAKERRITYREAVDVVRKESPAAFKAYMDVAGGSARTYGDSVADLAERVAAEQHVSFRVALEIVREENPEAWEKYISGAV